MILDTLLIRDWEHEARCFGYMVGACIEEQQLNNIVATSPVS